MMFRLLFLTLWLGACIQIPTVSERVEFASNIASQKGWKSDEINADIFNLRVYLPKTLKKTETLNVYIEGDGLAWITSSTPSFDPTPINPLALTLAMLDTDASVYLARPCQFVSTEQQHGCSQKYWTSHRFSPEVIEASSNAVSQLKRRHSASKIRLIGYSGGGAVAALVAAVRDDVVQLVTVAGNLDHVTWTKQHRLSPLSGSLNPADAWGKLQSIQQRHYVGGKDTISDLRVAQSYANRFGFNKRVNISVIPSFDHYCCWESVWPSIVESKFGGLSEHQNAITFKIKQNE